MASPASLSSGPRKRFPMRRLIPQVLSAAAFFGLVAVVIFSGATTGRGQVVAQATAKAVGKSDAAKAKAETVDYITFPSDRDAKQKLQAVIDYLKGANPGNEKWEQICIAAQ